VRKAKSIKYVIQYRRNGMANITIDLVSSGELALGVRMGLSVTRFSAVVHRAAC
jgi:hypothetical protein